MRHFLKLCEVVDEQGGVLYFSPGNKDLPGDGGKWTIDPAMSPNFAKLVLENNVFVFSKTNPYPVTVAGDLLENYKLDVAADFKIDAPFSTFSIEMIDGPITSPRLYDKHQVYTDCIMVHEALQKNGPPIYFVMVLCRMPDRTKPGKWLYSVTLDVVTGINASHRNKENDDQVIAMIVRDPVTGEETQYINNKVTMEIVEKFLDRLETEDAGKQNVNHQQRVGRGKERKLVKIKRIIHITPKQTRKSYELQNKIEVAWSHRWFSRGHWRDIGEGNLGKDRDGNYCVPGRTWVTESIKGPDHLPQVRKTRLVKETNK